MNYPPRYESYPGYSTVHRQAPHSFQQPPSSFAKYGPFDLPPRRQHARARSYEVPPTSYPTTPPRGPPPPAYFASPQQYSTSNATYVYQQTSPAEHVSRSSSSRPRAASMRRPSQSNGPIPRVRVSVDSNRSNPVYHEDEWRRRERDHVDEGYNSGNTASPPPPYNKYQSGVWVAEFSTHQTSHKEPPPMRRSSSTRQRSASYSQPASNPRPKSSHKSSEKKPKAPRQATAKDCARAQIPAGYNTKNWDPTEEPILLLGSVFDANSLGKWIYDFTVYHHGAPSPMSDMAGDLWLLLIQLAGKIKRAEECMGRIRNRSDKRLVEDFLDSGERIWGRFNKILKSCEDYMWRVAQTEAKKKGRTGKATMGPKSGCEFVDTIFGRDRQLGETEKLMTGMRLWSHRFDVNCEEIMLRP